ncbi:hypothetical protein FA95DRAFT_1611699 [Auriscalpium vulgare]|uniref:Uncharacterized protein n=1 Tax=Auriscalpium vulgare TaxID=40419 RepID=A0ACB8RAH0_9AGAM|nr:hypothetical protein FA95DRAFT_1611699 [Auriscalpium vulgare]
MAYLTGQPCDQDGNFLPPNAPPLPVDDNDDNNWEPFADRPSFQFAELLFEKTQTSAGDINELLKILQAKDVVDGIDREPIYESADNLYATIDDIEAGVPGWETFKIRYNGPITADSPAWKREEYVVHTRNALQVMKYTVANPEFKGKWHSSAFKEYTAPHARRWSDFMSGSWAWKQSDTIARDPDTHGAMLVPTILGADKTTVSVATGNQEFHPVYISPGNLHNEMRRAHGEGVMILAFLAIPKTCREFNNDDEFRLFRKQLYHASLARIMDPLRAAMTKPIVIQCSDGHFRRVIFSLGPFIADYPEQVFLASVVSGWCPKCFATPAELHSAGERRTREQTEEMVTSFDAGVLWDGFGIVGDVIPFTNHFPRADIHELLSPDLLHQLIKGTFKDHLVAWVEDYLELTHGAAEGKRMMDDIDRRIAAAPPFPGLRRFPEGRNFKQWTGDDSKALMKVFLPALSGYVPDDMIQCIAALLDFAYLARRPSHSTPVLNAMDRALARFHRYRQVFEDAGIRPDGFSLPRQHALVHYVRSIRLFGSPNGLCSSITESKHIASVKRPWRRSSRNKPLPQILVTNTRLSKLAAARSDFGRRNMLRGDVLVHSLHAAGIEEMAPDDDEGEGNGDAVDDAQPADGIVIDAETKLAYRAASSCTFAQLGYALDDPGFLTTLRRFLFDQLHRDVGVTADDVDPDAWPDVYGGNRVSIYPSASSTFYAPSEASGTGGMHREIIRSVPRWFNNSERRDTVLIQSGDEDERMAGMVVGRVLRFISFKHDDVQYPCAVINWFLPADAAPDPIFGLWKVVPEKGADGRRTIAIVHIDCIVRACHLMPVYGESRVPHTFRFTDTLTAFRAFYVNRYIDYHAHETIQ